MKRIILKGVVLLICFFVCSCSSVAQEKVRLEKEIIRFTWKGDNKIKWESSTMRSFRIAATKNERFTVDWGDNSIMDTITATRSYNLEEEYVKHIYPDTNEYTVTITGITNRCLFTTLYVYNFDDTNKYKLTMLDVSRSPSLKTLLCTGNSLTVLDLHANTELEHLGCGYNFLNNLDLSANTKLQTLSCRNNPLKKLDLSANKELWSLECYHNQLTNLDLSTNTKLVDLWCSANQLISLNLSNSTKLKRLSCSKNQLKSLDLSASKKLHFLYCDSNQLSVLILSKNKLLTFDCKDNHFQLSDLYNISKRTIRPINLGTQTIPPEQVIVGNSVDYSAQNKFGGIYTVFKVEKDSLVASESDYTIIDGIITFHNIGNYKITMTNKAIFSGYEKYHPTWYTVQVIAEIIVVNKK